MKFLAVLALLISSSLSFQSVQAAQPPGCLALSGINLSICAGANNTVPVGVDLYLDGMYYDTVVNIGQTLATITLPANGWCLVQAAAWDMATNTGHSTLTTALTNADPACGTTNPQTGNTCIDSIAYDQATSTVLSSTTHCF